MTACLKTKQNKTKHQPTKHPKQQTQHRSNNSTETCLHREQKQQWHSENQGTKESHTNAHSKAARLVLLSSISFRSLRSFIWLSPTEDAHVLCLLIYSPPDMVDKESPSVTHPC
ncbi:mCG147575 [Mus musculus]|nr:mCG147575 [Mus musculus]